MEVIKMGNEKESEYREIDLKFLKPIGKTIGWIIGLITAFCFFETMAREFSFFDEFSIFIVLVIIAIRHNEYFTTPEK